MKVKLIIFIFLSFFLSSCSDDKFNLGDDYRELHVVSKSKSNQVVLFFSPVCPHCYKFDEVFERWIDINNKKQQKSIVERIPVDFDKPQWVPFKRAYAALRVLGLHDKMTAALFKVIHKDKLWVGDARGFSAWLKSEGYDYKTVYQTYQSKDVDTLLESYKASERMFNVRSIPLMLVNGVYQVKLSQLNDVEEDKRAIRLNEIVEFLQNKQED
jgi:thiol:disulfide interchange protein DsbA